MMVLTWSRVVNSYCTTIASWRGYENHSTRLLGFNVVSEKTLIPTASPAPCRTSLSQQGRLCNPNSALPKNYCRKGRLLSARWPKKLKPSRPRRCGVLYLDPQPQPPGMGYPPDLLLELSIMLKSWPDCLQPLQNTFSSEYQRNYCYFK